MKKPTSKIKQRNKPVFNQLSAFILSATLIVFGFHPSSYAETYFKWQNAEGNWVYGAHPPKGSNPIEVKTHAGSSTPQPTDPTPSVDPAAKNLNEETCERAKANLAALNSDAIIQRVDENGEQVTLTQEEREEEKTKAQSAIDRFCLGIK